MYDIYTLKIFLPGYERGGREGGPNSEKNRNTTEEGMEGLRYYANNQERYRGTGSAMPEDVVHLAFIVSDAGI